MISGEEIAYVETFVCCSLLKCYTSNMLQLYELEWTKNTMYYSSIQTRLCT